MTSNLALLSLLSGPAVSSAVSSPDNSLTRLVQTESDDRRLAEEIFLRVLARPASPKEVDAALKTRDSLEAEHGRLTNELARAEAVWAETKPKIEKERQEAMAKAEKTLKDNKVKTAPQNAPAQRGRPEKNLAPEQKVKEPKTLLPSKLADWEKGISAEQQKTLWVPLDAREVQGTGSAKWRNSPTAQSVLRAAAGIARLHGLC
jgi:predicted nucleic acid-binding protein